MLDAEFQRIKAAHREALKRTASRVVLGASVMRVYASGTREALIPVLSEIDIESLKSIPDQDAFSKWFDSRVDRVARVINRHNARNSRIAPGVKWGHATKIVALFVRDLVLSSRYFSDGDAERISHFLYVPIDGVVIRRLSKLGIHLPFSKIKDIDSRVKFYEVQERLAASARKIGVPRVWFDDNWGDRQ